MTKEEYTELLKACETMQDTAQELKYLYDTYHSPRLDEPIKKGSRPSDPVSKIMRQIEAVQERRTEAIETLCQMELKLDEIKDHELCAIIRNRMIGKSFKEIGEMLGRTGAAARKKLDRYLEETTHTQTYTHTHRKETYNQWKFTKRQ